MQLIRFVLLLFFSVVVQAQSVEITDPRDQLKWIRGAADRPAFNTAFRCGEPLPFFVRTGQCAIHCQFAICEQMCDWPQIENADFQVEECTNESAFLYSTKGHSIQLTAADYKASGNTVALSLIKAIPIFYQPVQKIEIYDIGSPIAKKFIEDGKMKTVFITPITVLVFPNRTKPESIMLELALDLSRSGLDQLMCFSEALHSQKLSSYFIKRKGLISAN
ncbi:MAG: hypothetical protein V4654_00450 [Bdellovibrionota bacterium]